MTEQQLNKRIKIWYRKQKVYNREHVKNDEIRK